MKINREAVGLAVLLVVFVVAGLLVSSPSNNDERTVGTELTADPSINNDRTSGSKAFFEWTKKLGYRPVAETADWNHLPTQSKLLISIAPESIQGFAVIGVATGNSGSAKLSPQDARGVIDWLKGGRTLLMLSSHVSNSDDSSDDSDSGDDNSSDAQTFGSVMGFTCETAQYGKSIDFSPTQPSPLVVGVNSIRLTPTDARVHTDGQDFIGLFGSIHRYHEHLVHYEPTVVEFPEGKGRVIVISDDYFASNGNLGNADNAVLLSNILSTSVGKGDTVLFDEYHHGDIGGSGGGLWNALGLPVQSAFIQLGLVMVLIIAMVGPRFGAVKVLKQGEIRTSGEYLTSLADLYRRADATIPALESLYRQFLRDLCSRLALPPDIPLDKLADVAAKRAKIKPEGLRQLISACEKALETKRLTAPDLLTLTKQMEAVKRQLG